MELVGGDLLSRQVRYEALCPTIICPAPLLETTQMSNLLLLQKSHSVFVSRHLCEHMWERFQEVGITESKNVCILSYNI